jgi:hypothetical protein
MTDICMSLTYLPLSSPLLSQEAQDQRCAWWGGYTGIVDWMLLVHQTATMQQSASGFQPWWQANV